MKTEFFDLQQQQGMHVLVADDDPVSRRILTSRLTKWDYRVVVASDGDEASSVLESENAPRMAILDWMMPGKDGIELCRQIRARRDVPYTYLILLTARGERDDVIEGLDAGADDYVCKPFDAQELRVRLRAGSRIVELQDELIRAREELREQATHDPLTGLLNRGAILDFLHREISRCGRDKGRFAVVMLDLDHFKSINDEFGHQFGDAVLFSVATTMRGTIRPYDAIGRYGGEEFLLVLPGANVEGAAQQAERMRRRVASTELDGPKGKIEVAASLGVCAWTPDTGVDVEALLQTADEALYRAKAKGRNRVETASKDDVTRSKQRGNGAGERKLAAVTPDTQKSADGVRT